MIIRLIPSRRPGSARELIFATATNTGVQAWLRRWCKRERIAPAFRPHDLRRTCATRLDTLGVLPHITERILNHTMQGVMGVYDRADYENASRPCSAGATGSIAFSANHETNSPPPDRV